jgi:hypothetical protein
MSKKFTGAEKIEIQQAGGDFSSPDATIEEPDIHGDTALEVEENTDQTDPSGNSPYSGQFANVTIQSSDFGALTTLQGFRTATPETLIDVRFHLPDGADGTEPITVEGIRAKTMLQPVVAEHGQVNAWSLESRGFTPDPVHFDV